MNLKTLFYEFSHLFFPDVCPVCEKKMLQNEDGLCLQCIYKLPRTHNFKEQENAVEKLLAGRFPFERIASFCVFSKGGMLQPIIHEVKYNDNQRLGILLGKLFGKDLANSDFITPIDIIVPVPLHPKKYRKRRYNQSELIARGLSEATHIPISTNNLIRVINNPTQTKKSKNQRWDNVKGIFEVKNPMNFQHKHILLVDDVITTGSTLEACADALLRCNDIKISIATVGEVF